MTRRTFKDFHVGAPVMRQDSHEIFYAGHITGFDRNALGELTFRVKWEDGHEFPIHPRMLIEEYDWPPAWPKDIAETSFHEKLAEEERNNLRDLNVPKRIYWVDILGGFMILLLLGYLIWNAS